MEECSEISCTNRKRNWPTIIVFPRRQLSLLTAKFLAPTEIETDRRSSFSPGASFLFLLRQLSTFSSQTRDQGVVDNQGFFFFTFVRELEWRSSTRGISKNLATGERESRILLKACCSVCFIFNSLMLPLWRSSTRMFTHVWLYQLWN